METKFKIVLAIVIASLISGCAIHNTPDTLETENYINPNSISNEEINAFVDQNGTFYPNEWEEKYGTPCKINCWRKHYSLIANANSKGKDSIQYLATEEDRIIGNFENKLNASDRIFILVHGYNNDASLSKRNYARIKEIIELKESDAVIEFFWDGLISKSSVAGDAKIWFKATGYSQLAGAEGLRDILNSVSNKEIFIITHSRGASVALSSLSNPPYGKGFAEETLETHLIDVSESKPLENKNNKIKLLMLAPAVGDVDFKKPSYYQGDTSYRSFSNQLVSISYTVNPNDSILKKILGWPNVAEKFNPTDLGYSLKSGDPIKSYYGNVKSYDFSETDSHNFIEYLGNSNFILMLSEAGVKTR